MLFHCEHTSFLWQIINVHLMQGEMFVQRLIANANHMQPSQQQEWATLSIAILWNIWLTRNRKVFDNVEYSRNKTMQDCWDLIAFWANRCRRLDRRWAIKDWAAANRPA
jgi:hypothetical protein